MKVASLTQFLFVPFVVAVPLLAGCAGSASTVSPEEVKRLYPPGSLHAPIQDDPVRAGPGGTINPETGVANRQSGGF